MPAKNGFKRPTTFKPPVANQEMVTLAKKDFQSIVANAIATQSRFFRWAREPDPRRSIDDSCGYPPTTGLTPELLREFYDRDAIAARVVDILPEESWQVNPNISEDDDPEISTPFEEALDALANSLREESWYDGDEGNPLWELLLRADKLCGIGAYGGILLGIDDGKELSEPADGLDDFGKKTGAKEQKLIYARAFDQSLCKAAAFETDRSNPRYGHPKRYNITINDPRLAGQDVGVAVGIMSYTGPVHWTRVVHVCDNLGTSEVFGTPRQQPVFNRIMDLRKLYGGSAEMYWKGAFPGLGLKTAPGMSDVPMPTDKIKAVMENYFNDLQRYIALAGFEAQMLSPTVVDPMNQIKVHLEAICIRLGVPMRVFMGSERGELASSQDSITWNSRLARRQNQWITPRLIVPVIDRMIALGLLPEPESYHVTWPTLLIKTDTEKVDAALKKTQALGAYISGQVESLIAPMDYLTKFLDFEDGDAESMLESAEDAIDEKRAEGESMLGQPEPPLDEKGQPLSPADQQARKEEQMKAFQQAGGKGQPGDGSEEDKDLQSMDGPEPQKKNPFTKNAQGKKQ